MRESPLNTATVVGEAVRIADQQGVDELTMRHLASRLGVQAMAVYRYIINRDDLLDAMVSAMLEQFARTMANRTQAGTRV